MMNAGCRNVRTFLKMLDRKKRAGVATLVAAGLIAASSATAYGDSYSWDGRTTHYVGVKINYGDGWIGSYRLNNRTHHGSTGQFYCADPEKDGPRAGGTYQSRGSTTRWARDGGGSLSPTALSQVAWVLGKWGATSNNKQAAAVDAAVYALEGFPTYQLGSSTHGRHRSDAAGVTARAQAMVAEAKARAAAGNYKLNVDIPSQVPAHSRYKATVRLVNGAGRPVPGEKVTLVDGRNSKVTVTTNKAGVGSATFGTLDRAAKVSAAATLPATAVT